MNLSALKEKAKNLFAGKREEAEPGTDDASSAAQEAENKLDEQTGSPTTATSPDEPPSPPAASGPGTGGTAP